MYINNKNLCTCCFEEKPESQGPCSVCGYVEGQNQSDTVLAPGTLLMGKYAIGKVLGKGGFGVTYLAYDLKRECKAAIKEYMPDALAYRTPGNTIISTYEGDREESFRLGAEKFYEEAKTVSRFNGHPNIINVQEFFYENNTAYFDMEYIEGVDLKTYVDQKGGTLSEAECFRLLAPILDALIVVHSVGVLHRDISPDNIYVTKDEGVKLLDFGAARQVLGEKSKSLSVILKPGFAPFEQYQTRGRQGPWTDVYALAATMYYCLTGLAPEAAMDRMDDDSQEFMEKLRASVSESAYPVMQKAMAVKAAERYGSVVEFKQALLLAAEQTGTQAEPLSKGNGSEQGKTAANEASGKNVSTKTYLAIAAAVVVLIAITMFWVYGRGGEHDQTQSATGIASQSVSGSDVVPASGSAPTLEDDSNGEADPSLSGSSVEQEAVKTTVKEQEYKYSGKDYSVVCKYTGEWEDGKPNGSGELTILDFVATRCDPGDRITAVFRNGKITSAPVKVEYNDGTRYEGQYTEGIREGHGILHYDDFEFYKGNWKGNLRSGYGEMAYNDGSRYKGEWLKDQRQGVGTLFDKDGNVIQKGTWKNDQFVGESEPETTKTTPAKTSPVKAATPVKNEYNKDPALNNNTSSEMVTAPKHMEYKDGQLLVNVRIFNNGTSDTAVESIEFYVYDRRVDKVNNPQHYIAKGTFTYEDGIAVTAGKYKDITLTFGGEQVISQNGDLTCIWWNSNTGYYRE